MKLSDGRTMRARLVGTDPVLDVALIKVDAAGPLPFAPLGNSDELRVGEWVCAIGNPLGYVHSVTVGVVSFIGRKLFDASLDDYIQTDRERPEVGPLDSAAVAAWFLERLGRGSGAERIMALTWQQSGILEVARRAPAVTAAGKVLAVLRIGRRKEGDGRGEPI